MNVISLKALGDFRATYADTESSLRAWYKAIRNGTFRDYPELKRTFPSADYVPVRRKQQKKEFYVFNIGGNKYRLVAAIHFDAQRCFVRFVLTHAEYDREDWKYK